MRIIWSGPGHGRIIWNKAFLSKTNQIRHGVVVVRLMGNLVRMQAEPPPMPQISKKVTNATVAAANANANATDHEVTAATLRRSVKTPRSGIGGSNPPGVHILFFIAEYYESINSVLVFLLFFLSLYIFYIFYTLLLKNTCLGASHAIFRMISSIR